MSAAIAAAARWWNEGQSLVRQAVEAAEKGNDPPDATYEGLKNAADELRLELLAIRLATRAAVPDPHSWKPWHAGVNWLIGERYDLEQAVKAIQSNRKANWSTIARWENQIRAEFIRLGCAPPRDEVRPTWNKMTGELRFGDAVVRKVTKLKEACRIVPILDAFQAAGWPETIEDPNSAVLDPMTRYYAIASLNSGIKKIHFRADGTGARIAWRKGRRKPNRQRSSRTAPE